MTFPTRPFLCLSILSFLPQAPAPRSLVQFQVDLAPSDPGSGLRSASIPEAPDPPMPRTFHPQGDCPLDGDAATDLPGLSSCRPGKAPAPPR